MQKKTYRTGNIGKPIALREAVVLGVKSGWTSKETAYETGWLPKTLQTYAARMELSFAYGGMGKVPRYTPKDLTLVRPDVKLNYGNAGKDKKTTR